MTTQAAPDFNAELARQTKATESAQALADHYKASADRLRGQIERLTLALDEQANTLSTYVAAHRMAERHVAELLLARSAADREVGALTGERDELRRQVEELRRLNAQETHV